ncbi:MAG: alpha-2-macroglobulin family protein [Victivallaceae bacterium]
MKKIFNLIILLLIVGSVAAADPVKTDIRKEFAYAEKMQESGNVRDAFALYKALLTISPKNIAGLGKYYSNAVDCLIKTGRINEFDEFTAMILQKHDSRDMLQAAATAFMQVNHHGYLIGGQFIRGHSKNGGEKVSAFERDRVLALRLLMKAVNTSGQSDNVAKAQIYTSLATALIAGRDNSNSYKLQYLTDISKIPPYERFFGYIGMSRLTVSGAPVDNAGNPVFYNKPASFERAQNDGERWRLALALAKDNGYERAKWDLALFLYSQFGVHTIGNMFNIAETTSAVDNPFAVQLLKENETIARLACGIKRFKLPDEFNYIKMFREIAASGGNYAADAMDILARIFTDRKQYGKAAGFWKSAISAFGKGNNEFRVAALEQITGNLGCFMQTGVFPAGKAPRLDFRYRNAPEANIEVFRIDIDSFVNDIKSSIQSKSEMERVQRLGINPESIGNWLLNSNEQKYCKEKLAAWQEKLQPRKDNMDNIANIKIPLKKAGVYLVKASLPAGNTSMQILWITDTVLAERTSGNSRLYVVMDATSGKPIPSAELSFFGFSSEFIRNPEEQKQLGSRFKMSVHEFEAVTDARGFCLMDANSLKQNYQYMVSAKTADGRKAIQGFSYFYGNGDAAAVREEAAARKVFCITDRPVYCPGQKMFFKYWIRNAGYGNADAMDFAGKTCKVIINSPRGKKLFEKDMQADQSASLDGSFELPSDIELGICHIYIEQLGGSCSFRVEEYRKTEYEVQLDGPEKTVKTGDSFNITLKADYYFNAPVANAKVKYKVLRYFQPENWVQPSPWNWLYGDDFISGAKPAARNMGIPCPNNSPPELVMENETYTDSNGHLKLTIDSAPAKILYGNIDCRYEVTAEVVDTSLNTVVARKTFITAGKPFKVYSWLDKGYYRTDNYAVLNVQAVYADGRNVTGTGLIKLSKLISDKKGVTEETVVKEAKVSLDENGAILKFRVGDSGQYRITCDVTDSADNTIRGKCLLRVFGEKMVYDDFTFNPVEIIPEKNEYAPGETADLIIGTEKKEATVLLFGKDSAIPETLDIHDKNIKTSINIRDADMPNVFVEAWSVSEGKLNREVKQITIPPVNKALNIVITAAEKQYKPSMKAKITLKVTDNAGEPVKSARLVVTGYDKAIEYISGGSNIPDIKPYFWGWKHYYGGQYSSNLGINFENMVEKGQTALQPLGVLGDIFSTRRENGRMSAGSPIMMTSAAKSAGPQDAADEDPGLAEKDYLTARKNFSDSLVWSAKIQTDSSGEAEVAFNFPDNLTTWKIRAWSIGDGCSVGQGETELVTSKDFFVRMVIPRFITEDDEVVIAGIVHNYEKNSEAAKVVLRLDGDSIKSIDTAEREITVPVGENVRVDWMVRAFKKGTAGIEISASGKNGSDAVRMELPVDIHGMEKQISFSGCLNDDSSGSAFITLDVPANRIPESVQVALRYSPSIAISVVNVLPSLIAPEGKDTISAINRLAPVAAAAKALKKFDISLKELKAVNSQGLSGESSAQWRRIEAMPVFDDNKMLDYAAKSLEAIQAMQNADGGWGWFSGFYELSWPDTTAYVVRGLITARDNGINVNPVMLSRGIAWLKVWMQARSDKLQSELVAKQPLTISNMDGLVLYVLAIASQKDNFMAEQLYVNRNQLSLYGLTLCGLTLLQYGDSQKLDMVMQNLSQFTTEDPENQTVFMKFPDNNCWWNWTGNEIETQAFYLKLLAKYNPKGKLAAGMTKYLVNNRKYSDLWGSPRETALCVEALADYFVSSNEINSNINLEVFFDGQLKKQVNLNSRNLLSLNSELLLGGNEISSGKHTLELRRKGTGSLFFNASLCFFSLEKTIKNAKSDLGVERKYYKLIKDNTKQQAHGIGGAPLLQNVEGYKRLPVNTPDKIKAGELIEVELIITAKNDFEYIVISDHKAAGFEPAEYLSGYCGSSLGAYIEYREREVAFYIRRLPRGAHSLTYRVRAEFPGVFNVLPATGTAVYAPELKVNSDDNRITIEQ